MVGFDRVELVPCCRKRDHGREHHLVMSDYFQIENNGVLNGQDCRDGAIFQYSRDGMGKIGVFAGEVQFVM